MTRSQKNLLRAHALVSSVEGKEVREIYGGLCHSFPVMVRTCGLCQAIAFSLDKAQSGSQDRARAHSLLLSHLWAVIQNLPLKDPPVADPGPKLLEWARTAETPEYMLRTRLALDAWVYFKRFAVSILKAQPGAGEGGE